MNALRAYLGEKKGAATALAKVLGVSVSTVTRLADGERGPSLEMAHRIAKATRGRVPVKSWLGESAAA